MSIDITNIVIALIGVLSAVVTAVLVPWLKTKLDNNRIGIVQNLASIAVYAAQQLYSSCEAQEKKEYAVNYVSEALKKYNITLSVEEISTYIEGILKNIKVDEGSEW